MFQKKLIKKAIDSNRSFELYTKFKSNQYDVSFEFAGYNHATDSIYNYNLRENHFTKRLRYSEKAVWKTLKSYGK